MADEQTSKSRPLIREQDIEAVHSQILREPAEPREGYERPPWWLWTGVVASIFFGGFYLGRFGGQFGLGTHQAYGRPEPLTARTVTETRTVHARDPVAHGVSVYEARCQACHQANGKGLPGAFPPLLGSEWVVGAPERLVAIVLHGLAGPIDVIGTTYNGAMPGWGNQLSDEEIAAVATYVRQWDENDAGPVTTDEVARLRERTSSRAAPWTAVELAQELP